MSTNRFGMVALLALLASWLTVPASQAATWDPDVRLVFTRGGDIWISHPSGSDQVNLTPGGTSENSPSLSHTGRYVAYKKGTATWVYDFETGQHAEVPAASGSYSGADFSPTDDRLAWASYQLADDTHRVYSVGVDGTGLKDWLGATDDIKLSPRWTADGQGLVYVTSEGARVCSREREGFAEDFPAYRLKRVTSAGSVTELAGSDSHQIIGGQENGGVLAYIRRPLPPTEVGGYCESEPVTDFTVVSGAGESAASPGTPSVSSTGDVAYGLNGSIVVDPAGPEGPQTLFAGSQPDWGVAYAAAEPECTITGTEGDDRLEGTPGPDVICGLGGDDYLFGYGGNDLLYGGDGEDDLIGGPGDDQLFGGEDSDALRGEEGDDLLDGGPGVDLVTYFTMRSKVTVDLPRRRAVSKPHGTDSLVSVEGAFGSKTGDLLIGDRGSNHLFGGPGADVVRGGGGTDLLRGNAGKDSLEGGGGGDLLEGDAGKDRLHGGAARDVCYDDDATRKSCEHTEKDDPSKAGKPPKQGSSTGTVGRVSAVAGRAGGLVTYWYLGKGDYLTVYNRAATQALGSWAATSGWESQTCRFIRLTPARGACSAAGALNTVSKYQMKWFLWNAKRNNGCAIGILDWGRHGVNQFKKRWKTRSATYHRYNVAIPWLTPGRPTDVKTSGGGAVRVGCS